MAAEQNQTPIEAEAPPVVETPAQAEPSPEAKAASEAKEAELKDISELLEGLPPVEEPKKAPEPAKAEPEKKPEAVAKPDGEKEEQKTAPAVKPGEEKPKPEVVQPEKSLKDMLKEALAEDGEKAPKEAKPTPDQPKYTPNLPDELFAAIEHEDPAVRRQGLNAMIGSAMSRVYSDIRKELAVAVAQIRQEVPVIQQQTQEVQAAAKKTHDDFYEANPAMGSTPAMKKLVATVAMQKAQALGKEFKGVSPEFLTSVAADIEAMTGGAVKAGKTAPAKKEDPAPKPKTFQAGGPPARVNGGTEAQSLSDEIMDVIG